MTKSSKRVQRLIKRQKVREQAQSILSTVAVGYIRVSTDEQAKRGHGLQSQAKAIRAFAESQGYELLDVISDPGVTGPTSPLQREGFKQIVELAEQGAFSVLLVWKIDRLARSLVHAVTTAHSMQEQYNVVLRSVTEPIDTSSPMGRTIFAILAGMAEQERQAITERTLAGRKAKADKGGFAGGSIPFGYRSDGNGNMVINEIEAVIVRDIFNLRAQGQTLKQIGEHLTANGVPTRRGGKWHPATVRYILDNPKYRGNVEYFFRWKQQDESCLLRSGKHMPIV